MVDTTTVLAGQTIAYTCYVLAIMAGMGWFAYKVTRTGSAEVASGIFYAFVTLLVVIGVSLHIITHETIPWKAMDLNRAEIRADREFAITVSDHKFILPAEKLVIRKGEKARFTVTSNDLTYGFGLFRPDNSMLFQMQVLPGHVNDILWQFDRPGRYSIRSTEYSGWKGINMIVRDAVEVVE
ncbi:MAG: Cytochrome C oxidase subunit II, periplasmic domain [bacterium ADurb.Bin478]|nr:MAG: Cytochrome C oxidase subunit II, periplasmic domain [bacterium ADurb.Bin478]